MTTYALSLLIWTVSRTVKHSSHLSATTAPDIILACKTKVDKTIKHTEFLPANYTGHIRLDCINRGGGVMICHRKDLVIDKVELIKPNPADLHDEIVWAWRTVKGANPMYIGSYYRSCANYKTNGDGSNHMADSISGLQISLDSLSKMHIQNNTHATIMLGGDFNVADIDQHLQTRFSHASSGWQPFVNNGQPLFSQPATRSN